MLDDPLIAALRARAPRSRVLVEEDIPSGYLHDEAAGAPFGQARALVLPQDTPDVCAIVGTCAEFDVPLVPRGAGTGLSGGANAVDGCVVISTERMNQVREVDVENQTATVQPGVVNDDLKRLCAEHGLWYPPDPASSAWSTIGGNVATNAGGICCVKYGVTGDHVLGLEVVVGDGTAVRLGCHTVKGVAGYDLRGLFVGSEGTLGVVTEVTLRLRSRNRTPPVTVVGFFKELADAGRAVAAVAACGVTPAALELVDRNCLRAVDEWKRTGMDRDAAVLLLARSDAPPGAAEEEGRVLMDCFNGAGATWADVSTDPVESEALFEARRLAYPALARLGPVLTEDVCVPRRHVPEMLARISDISATWEIPVANIAHAGDGNLHPLIRMPSLDAAATVRVQHVFDEIMDAAIALSGTVTAEHGIGLLKRDGMRREMSLAVIAMQRSVKEALDPRGIFNPGKILG
ncbi:FAD-binding oxidoreductase [Streptantibioticus rubrisoli]|uniref:FAD-binding protein n=1 Tax=Streptantibioticus rubrisoli TaxID=1387313 RepID=A0ABT1PMH8_9ACTN|nr:FAD-linked oxidase C-terminal domain-containing protein [Streptantibioticus rubrisoli]MCQ4046562.1 FAD-binding protein [Streptantibioticus rubrisoli]